MTTDCDSVEVSALAIPPNHAHALPLRGNAVPASSGQVPLVQIALPKFCEVDAQNGFAAVFGSLASRPPSLSSCNGVQVAGGRLLPSKLSANSASMGADGPCAQPGHQHGLAAEKSIRAVYFGDVANDDVKALADINGREFLMLAILAVAVLWMGIQPKPFTDVMQVSVTELLRHVATSKLN